MVVGDAGDVIERLPGAGRGLGVDDCDHLCRTRFEGILDLLGCDDTAPLDIHPPNLRPAARRDVAHALPEQPGDADEHFVARLHHIAQRRLHPRAAGARDGQGEVVLGLKDVTQQLHGAVGDGEKLGVEVPDHRRGHRAQDAGINIARAGAHQDSLGWSEFGERISHHLHLSVVARTFRAAAHPSLVAYLSPPLDFSAASVP